jgi:tetraprenyl-beta-curcumene synthase
VGSAGVALLLANARYWSTVAPAVRREIAHWRRRAAAIEDPDLRRLALEKLQGESFNAEAAAMLATLAPGKTRGAAVRAIVALEILYDYLDGLTETPAGHAPQDGERLMRALTDAVEPYEPRAASYGPAIADSRGRGYLEQLVDTSRAALGMLPGLPAVAAQLHRSAARGAAAQLHLHRASAHGTAELERWARLRSTESPLEWREFVAGAACSVLAIHALVAAAADPRSTPAQAAALDRTYLPIAALPTMLDSVIDRPRDRHFGGIGLLVLYPDSTIPPARLAEVVALSLELSPGRRRSHHVMILVGVVAYYASAPGAGDAHARAAVEAACQPLSPLLEPTLRLMRLWRVIRRLAATRRERSAARTSARE